MERSRKSRLAAEKAKRQNRANRKQLQGLKRVDDAVKSMAIKSAFVN
jgi:hypothetical protein